MVEISVWLFFYLHFSLEVQSLMLLYHIGQPKLVINNIEVLRHAILKDGDSSVCGPMYHDSLIWRIIALGANEKSLPVILVTSDRYFIPVHLVSSKSFVLHLFITKFPLQTIFTLSYHD